MKKKRLIILHDHRLIALRLNLRTVLRKFYIDQLVFLRAHSLAAEGEEKRKFLNQIEELRMILKSSIVVCAVCNRTEGDRIFYPRLDMWFCKDCLDKGVIPTKRDLS
jgi:hypothetical protein